MAETLTDKQQAFVDAYLKCWNATEAARVAKYAGNDATLASVGSENLRKPNIAAEISRRVTERSMSADEALVSMSDLARSNLSDFINVAGGIPIIDFEKAAKEGKLGLLKKITYGKGTISFELYDKQRAIETIGKHHGLWKDGVQININVDLVVQLVEELNGAGIDATDFFTQAIERARLTRGG